MKNMKSDARSTIAKSSVGLDVINEEYRSMSIIAICWMVERVTSKCCLMVIAIVIGTALLSCDPEKGDRIADQAVAAAASPVVGRIAFLSTRDRSLGVFIMNGDGSNQTQLTRGIASLSGPALSPDGSQIIFASMVESSDSMDFQIYSLNADGSQLLQLTDNEMVNQNPAYSPDGKKIAYNAADYDIFVRGAVESIYIMNADGTGSKKLTGALPAINPAFSPDGKKIVYMSPTDGIFMDIYIMNVDGTGVTRLTSHKAQDEEPSVTPDGTRIVFSSGIEGSIRKRWSGTHKDIFIMNIDGTGLTRLTSHPTARDFEPAVSADGSKIAFTSARDGNYEIYLMNIDGSGVTRLTNSAGADRSPTFASRAIP